MSILDNELLLRNGSTDLDANEATPASKDFFGPDQHPLTYAVIVPAAPTGTTPTLDVTIEESDDDSSFRTVLTFEQISAKGKYFVTGKLDGRYRRYTATVGGTTPNFGKVIIAPQIGGEYEDF
jgi:hypothetical protein